MAHTSEFVESARPDDDLAFLRSALRRYDPADRPMVSPPGSEPVGQQDPRRGRRAWSLVAVAATVVAAALIPVTLVDTVSESDDRQQAAAGALMTCQERIAAGVPDFVSSTEGGIDAAERATVTWFSPAKADRLTSALRAALPAGTCVWPGSGTGRLRFEDRPTYFSLMGGGEILAPSTDGRLVTATGDGTLMASIYAATAGPQDCFVGDEDTRFTTPDGILVSQQVASAGDARVLLVQAARADGSCIFLRASDEVLRQDTAEGQQGMFATGSVPLTMDELTALATAPGFDITS